MRWLHTAAPTVHFSRVRVHCITMATTLAVATDANKGPQVTAARDDSPNNEQQSTRVSLEPTLTSRVDSSPHIPSLDGIRAVAAFIVFMTHSGLEDIVPGLFGVTIFFFLSGYLISTLLRIEFEKRGEISLKNFYLRRMLRIFPPMYIVLFLLMLSSNAASNGHAPSVITVLAQLFHITNYYRLAFPDRPLISDSAVMWSLAVEEHYYLLYPVVLGVLLRHLSYKKIAISFLVTCLVALVWRCVLVFHFNVTESYTNSATDTRIDSLLIGCVMGIWLNPFLDHQFENVSKYRWSLILAFAVALLLVSFLYRSLQFRQTLRFTLQSIALFPIFFCAVRKSTWWVFRWLHFKPIRAFGLISYTFYLIHVRMLSVAGHWTGDHRIARAVVGFGLALAFSAAMYLLIEQRISLLRKRLHT